MLQVMVELRSELVCLQGKNTLQEGLIVNNLCLMHMSSFDCCFVTEKKSLKHFVPELFRYHLQTLHNAGMPGVLFFSVV